MTARTFNPLPSAAVACLAPDEPAPMDRAAFYGLAGDIVRIIEPHTEADAGAMLIQFLVAFGNCVGRGPHFLVENTPHFANEFAVIVGKSAKARKGTSFNRVIGLLAGADEAWSRDCHASGLVSGEGIVHAVRDDSEDRSGERIPGVSDKRLLIVEEEFGAVLSAGARRESSLTATLRSAWDGKDLRTLAKNSRECATAPHISVIGHITVDELKAKLRGHELSNGFANRHLWIFARRSRELPDGGRLNAADLQEQHERLAIAVEAARKIGQVQRDDEAAGLWRSEYSQLTADRTGTVGSVTSRLEAHAVRLSLIFALLDGSPLIRSAHLRAALAVCDYALRSAEYCFGGLSSDARTILQTLIARAPSEMTRTEISKAVFNGHKSAAELDAALSELERSGKATCRMEYTGGAPRVLWRSAN